MSREVAYQYVFDCDTRGCYEQITDDFNFRELTDDKQIAIAERRGWTFTLDADGFERWSCPKHPAEEQTDGK